jgi:hypothetical protein
MIPVVGREALGLDAAWIGFLAALEGAGAFFGAIAIAMGPVIRSYRVVYYFSILSYLVLIFAATLTTNAASLSVILFCVGIAGAGFSAMQNILIYFVAPPHMRSRLFGVVGVCIGVGLLGVANIGLMAEWFGASAAIRIVAAEGLIPLLSIGVGWRQLGSRAIGR